ncbi:glycosyltransferase family 2 protein [Roseisolibacter sp. H3M3-2]|uniref:glycosyltransferase family 2 protein n=1 Tax=Roseisolibacter sp. H3M3-2 TaxID=3031323 RepID=UPI0023DC1AD9|nr:glycosyltransferase family 2 protein [Roseisolibacter sp. H3M3-2]MDF1503985.1 glycosyltransferase family 2 protein [Roseisolibacter sp. H3M3-2]
MSAAGWAALLLAAQGAAAARVAWRLLPGRTRAAPVEPRPLGRRDTTVSVIVATLNEAARIGPCLDGLRAQGAPMLEALVVDSRSTDGTRALVEAAAATDPRLRLLTDAPLPDGWVGKVWALETGLRHARGEWVLGIDADTQPEPGLVCAVVGAARRHRLDVVSFAPRFADQSAGERWLQPAMLATLLYRVGAVGTEPAPERVMANGQCFLARREILERHGGYAPARASFCDDVSLARHLARRGARVGFLDGSRLYRVRSYRSAAEAWREWGRSFDLTDAATPARQALDLATVTLAQGLPLPVLLLLGVAAGLGVALPPAAVGLAALNAGLVVVRLLLQVAMRGSYDRRGLPWWGSVTADPVAVVRLWLSTLRRPTAWRGRRYEVATARSAPHVS